jgi:hypothetical protein
MSNNVSNDFPSEAVKKHFNSLISKAFSHAYSELSQRQKEFEREETQKGRALFGEGHSARLSVVYRDNLASRAKSIVEIVKTVHADFHYPLAEDVEQNFLKWAEDHLSNAEIGLQITFKRHHRSYGRIEHTISRFDLNSSSAQATVMNSIKQYFWGLRNVPARKPKATDGKQPMQITNNNFGSVTINGDVTNSTLTVQQQSSNNNFEQLIIAIEHLRQALVSSKAQENNQSSVDHALKAMDEASIELQRQSPDQAKLTQWLGAIGVAVSAIADIKPAYENLKTLANHLGLML